MSDIFISYASEDRDRLQSLIRALEETGWSVFWDRTIPAGRTWRQVIGEEIEICRCVMVVWTDQSVDKEFVIEEADVGKQKQILIPVQLDSVNPPFGFRTIQAADLTDWAGDPDSLPFQRLLSDLSRLLGAIPAPSEEKPEKAGQPSAPTPTPVPATSEPGWLPEMVEIAAGEFRMGDIQGQTS